jgi:hypothetical protein
MPISDDLCARNFITKITRYERVVDIPNSMTVLTELLPVSLNMAHKKLTGVYNFCNPGAISHNQILQLYKEFIDPNFTWKNFSLEEQALILKAGRSNNTLVRLCFDTLAVPHSSFPHPECSLFLSAVLFFLCLSLLLIGPILTL